MAYPLAMGLDIGDANKLRLTLQLASPLSIGGGQEGGGGGGKKSGGESATNITVDAPSIYSGLNMINNIISKQITTSHTKVIVISKRLAEAGVSQYLHALERGREFRPNTFIVVSNGPADEYLKNVKPLLESSPAKFYEMLLGKDFAFFYPTVRIHEFYFKSESNSVQPVAILTGLSKYSKIDELKDEKDSRGNELKPEGEYKAGDIPIIADQKSEVMGAAVFKDEKMVGTLNGTESVVFQMVTGDFKYSYMTVADPYDENYIIVLEVTQRRNPVIDVEIVDGIANVNILINLEADYTSIQSDLDYEDYPEIVEQRTEEMIEGKVLNLLKKTRDEFNADICGIGSIVKRKYLTWDSWEKYDWFSQYKNAKFKVDVKLKIRRTGLMVKSVN